MDSELSGRKTMEKTFCDPDDMFKDLAEKSLAGIYLIQDGVFRYGNPRFTEIFGYTLEEVTDKMGPEQMVFPEDWPDVRENITKRIVGAVDSIHYEFRGITKNREVINVEVYGSRTIYKNKPAVIGTLLDITKRKTMEKLLKETEEKYRDIFENAVEGIFQATVKGHFIVANQALVKMLGYHSADELKTSVTYRSPQLYVNKAGLLELFRLLGRNGIVRDFEAELYKKGKDKIWVSINARVVKNAGGVMAYYEGAIKDITEEKKAKDELRRMNDFNSAVINNSPVGIFILNKDGVFTSINPSLAAISGLGVEAGEKLIGFNWIRNPYTIKCGLASHIKKGLRGEPFQLWDFPYVTYRGDRNLYMDFIGVPLKGKDGRIEGLLCILEETTDRVKIRAKLMQESRMSAIGRLAAGIAHELNNPLATLVAHAELAGDCLECLSKPGGMECSMEELRQHLDIIEAQAFRCKNVTSDILSLPWKEGFEQKKIDINKLLNNILECMHLGHFNGKIVKEYGTRLPPLIGDIGALRQVFVNLINNAADAVEERMDARIWIRTRAADAHVIIEIEDNGSGIPDAIAEKIFEPFFTTKESKRGIGLGLSLCHEFVTHMGGVIKAESRPGGRTRLFVSLPAAAVRVKKRVK